MLRHSVALLREMNLQELAIYRTILVTGSNRAGTGIASEIIAYETKHRCIREKEFRDGAVKMFLKLFDEKNIVVQCPFMCHIVHDLPYLRNDIDMDSVLVVFMHRPLADVVRSQMKAKFANGSSVDFIGTDLGQHGIYHADKISHSATLKAEAWREQKTRIPHTLDLEYESLSAHKLWQDKRNFSLRQTHVE